MGPGRVKGTPSIEESRLSSVRFARLRSSLLEPIEIFGILHLRLETGEGGIMAMRIGRRRGHIDERLRGRCRRPVLVRGRGVHVVRRVVSRVVRRVMSSRAT